MWRSYPKTLPWTVSEARTRWRGGGRHHDARWTGSRHRGLPGRTDGRCWLRLSLAAGLWIAVIATAPAALAGPAEDAYVAGYATAVLERQMDVRGSKITVKDGVVTVEVAGLPRSEHEKLAAALSTIGGVVRVEVVEQREPPATAPPATAPLPTTAATPTGPAVEAEVPRRGLEVLPKGLLFAPLIADPRWPHFSAVYQRFHEDARLGNAAIASLGETFSLVRGPLGEKGGAWEVGIQAGVFSLFDLDAPSSDLVNTDYIVGFPFAYRARNFSALARFYHQSSHLGDEFLIENRVERVNLSYEAIDLRLSYEVTDWLRLYGGGGYIVRGDPSDLEPWSTQMGFELRSPACVLRRDAPPARRPRHPVPRAERLAHGPVRAGRRPVRAARHPRPAHPAAAGVLQRLLTQRPVLPGQDRVHRARAPPLSVLNYAESQPGCRRGTARAAGPDEPLHGRRALVAPGTPAYDDRRTLPRADEARRRADPLEEGS